MNGSASYLRPVPPGCAGGGLGSTSTESRALVWTRAPGDDSDAEAGLPSVSCRTLCSDGMIVHHSSLKVNHRLESRMRETRLSGSEGGGTEFNRFSLPLSPLNSRKRKSAPCATCCRTSR